ncbi:hypothetical protein [Spiroplasma endosymbiont of Nebria brevicollis]|uniref:hypothetical protein n=1 Tax=Spiroplasma endosymbiont of Nebria brevicollis TaxID=3066284 RepID=UPI00313D4D15
MKYTTAKTVEQIITENKNIFDQVSNPVKQRHGGLTVKFSKDEKKFNYIALTILDSEKVISITKKIIDFKKQQWAIIKENSSLQKKKMKLMLPWMNKMKKLNHSIVNLHLLRTKHILVKAGQ